jgi:hypothetical protein
MALIGNISVGMSVNTGGLDKGLSKASSSISGFGAKMQSLGSSEGLNKLMGSFGQMADTMTGGLAGKILPQIEQLGSGLLGAATAGGGALVGLASAATAAVVAIAAAGAAVIAFGVSSIKPAADLIHLADRIGTTAGGLKQLHYIAKMSGSDSEGMDAAVQKLSISLGKASHEATPAGKALARIGLSAKDLASMDPADAMKLIIANFDKFPSSAEQAAAAMELFGKGGRAILGTLRLGSEGLAKLSAESEGTKGALEGVNGRQIIEANEAMEKLDMAWSALGTTIAVKIAPFVTEVYGEMTTWLKSITTEGTAANTILGGTAKMLQGIKGFLSGMVASVNPLAWLGMAEDPGADAAKPKSKRGGRAKGTRDHTPGSSSLGGTGDISAETEDAIVKGQEWQTELKGQIATMGMTSDAAELYKLKLAGIADADVEAIASLIKLKTQTKAIADGHELEKTLKDQIATFGMTTQSAELYKLAQAGIPPALMLEISALEEQKSQMEANKAVWTQMASDAKGFYEETRTPGEKLIEQQTKLNWLLTNGMITQDTFDRGMKKDLTDKAKSVIDDTRTPIETYQKKLGELEQLLRGGAIDTETFNRAAGAAEKAATGDNKPRFAQMAEMGSKEAYSAILQFQAQSNRADDPQKKLVKNSDEAIKIAREHLELAKRGTTGNTLPVYQFGA